MVSGVNLHPYTPEGAEEELRRKRKRQKVDDPHREEEATLAYPNTDAQYNNVCE